MSPGAPEATELPLDVLVELTNSCNLGCPLCCTHLAMHRPRGYMSEGLFRSLMAELAAWGPRPSVSMTMCGEPLLHPQVADLVDCAAEHGLHTHISTNATHLTPRLAERLVRGGLSAITVCVDGATAGSHEAYRVGSRFEDVRRSCEGLMEIRAGLASPSPRITVQTLLTAYSQDEMDEVVVWARRSGADEVHFKSLSLGTHTSPEQRQAAAHLIPTRVELRRSLPGASVAPCSRPVRQSMVFWNGDLGLCCVDFNGVAGLGHCRHGLAEALRSQAVREIRRAGVERRLDLCRRCAASPGSPQGVRVPLAVVEAREQNAAG